MTSCMQQKVQNDVQKYNTYEVQCSFAQPDNHLKIIMRNMNKISSQKLSEKLVLH